MPMWLFLGLRGEHMNALHIAELCESAINNLSRTLCGNFNKNVKTLKMAQKVYSK